MQERKISIGSRKVGSGEAVLVIAEVGVNHNGDVSLAKNLIDLAAGAGADVVKFQTFTAEALATPISPKADYQIETTSASESQLEMLRGLELSEDAHWELQQHCNQQGVM